MWPFVGASCGVRAGSGAHRHGDRFDRRGAAGRHGRRGARSDRKPLRSGDGRAVSIVSRCASAPTRSPRSCRASPDARTGVQLLVGQTAAVNLQMAPSTVQETVTVTAEAPLLNVSTSSLGGNVDPQQVQELPVNGRNWMALALLAPGSRTVSATHGAAAGSQRRRGARVPAQPRRQADVLQLGAGGQPRSARTRSRSSSSSRTGSTRRRGGRAACR